MNNIGQKGPRVLYIGWILPHYRAGVYQALRDSQEIDFILAGGSDASLGIPSIAQSELPAWKLHNRTVGPLRMQLGLCALIRRERPSIVIFEGDVAILTTWIATPILRMMKIKVFFWTTGWHRPDNQFKARIRRTFYLLADGLLLYSHVGRRIAEFHGVPPCNMRVIGNSSSTVQSPGSAEDIELPDWGDADTVMGAIISLKVVKRLEQVIQAAALMREREIDARVLFVGEGPARTELETLARTLRVPLSLPGPTYSSDQISRVYELLTVTVVPSTAGLTTIQSFAHGTPVVTHSNWLEQAPESEAIEPDVTGDMYPEGDIPALAEAVMKWSRKAKGPEGPELKRACHAVALGPWSTQAHAERIVAAIMGRKATEPELLDIVQIPSLERPHDNP